MSASFKHPGQSAPFLPMSKAELQALRWSELDVLLITGDAYVDHPSFGAAVIGRLLEADGWRVGIVAQPDWRSPQALLAMGRPRLFCGITAGNLDSMLANYTAARHKRKEDSYSEGGAPGKRPNHAAVVYAQLARQAFPGLPVVLGGIEVSMRRLAHYDYWEDKLRPSILLEAKADLLVYGMGESAVRDVARRLDARPPDAPLGDLLAGIPGTARLLGAKAAAVLGTTRDDGSAPAAPGKPDFRLLPSWEEVQADKLQFLRAMKAIEAEQNPFCGKVLVQFYAERAVRVEPPAAPLSPEALDAVYELPFQKRPHPAYRQEIPGYTMIKDSVTVVRGCSGGCSFCGLGLHQGKFLTSRSEASVLRELRQLASRKDFCGTVTDLGGPTANLYGCHNGVAAACRHCRRPSCLFPEPCPQFRIEEAPGVHLLRAAREVPRVKHVFVQSGIRMDVALRTPQYLRELVRHHVSGHLKVAPEHLHPAVLKRMRKPDVGFVEFVAKFQTESQAAGKEQYLVPYFISSFPGCTDAEMQVVEAFLRRSRWQLQQVQDFIPSPMTPAAAMYYSGLDYETEAPIPVVRNAGERQRQQHALRPAAAPSRLHGQHRRPGR